MRIFVSILSIIVIIYYKNAPWIYFFYIIFALSSLSLLYSSFNKRKRKRPVPDKISKDEIINEKLRNIKLKENLDLDSVQLLRRPSKYFEDAAHMCYVQKLLENSITIELFQHQFGLRDKELQKLIAELLKSEVISVNPHNELTVLVSTELDVKKCINDFYIFLAQAPLSELKKFREEKLNFSPSPIVSPFSVENKEFDNMDGHSFEYYCADLLTKNNYQNIEVTKSCGDQGIDILAYKNDIKYGIQCKCYTSYVGNKAVQEAVAGKVFYHCHVAVVMTNSYFTSSAKELAKSNQVLLWDREKLKELTKNSTE